MALIDEVQVRYSSARLIQLSNPDVTTATTINTTRLQAACDDSEGWFAAASGKSYTAAVASTIVGEPASAKATASAAVIAFLYKYRGLPGDKQTEAAFEEAKGLLKNYARQFGGLQWIAPVTDSVVQPSPQNPTIPDFDPLRNNRWVAKDPPGPSVSTTIGGFEPGF